MQMVNLDYVESMQEIRDSQETFNRDSNQDLNLVRDLLRQTSYWVYDHQTMTFGPSKFVGFRHMNFHVYALARQGFRIGDRFDGGATRRKIETLLGAYAQNKHLSAELIRWGEALSGPDVFNGINEDKWKFVSL